MFKTILSISTIFIFSYSCSENLLDSEPEPGSRDYIWTIDTLEIYSIAYRIWGSSPTDVWSINRSDFNNSFWHFDGNVWSTDGIHRFTSPSCIWGYSDDKIYVGSSNGQIWYFNGQDWEQQTKLSSERSEYVVIQDLWGKSPNNIFAMGAGPDNNGYFNESFIAHYNGSKWKNLNTNNLMGIVVHLYENIDSKIYFMLSKIGGTVHVDSTIIYEYKSYKHKKLYSSLETIGSYADISLIDNEVYFILGNDIARRRDNNFHTYFTIENSNFYHRIWGRNSKDIFILMTDGLAHYNGEDIQYLFYFTYPNDKPVTQIFGAAIFEKEVFFTTYEPSTNLKYIYHGKLVN